MGAIVSRRKAGLANTRLYDKLSDFNSSDKPLIVAFLWGLAEGTFFFVVPDFFTGFVALFNWKNSMRSCIATVAGSLAAAMIIFSLVFAYGVNMNLFLEKTPGISAAMISKANAHLLTNGVAALLSGPLEGIPYKVYTIGAALQGISLVKFLLFSIPARLERILPATILSAAAGLIFKNRIKRNPAAWIKAYLAVWVAIYLVYFWLL